MKSVITFGPCYAHDEDFRTVADAGAMVVSGSQAHYPHLMEFRGDSFIHYRPGQSLLRPDDL